MSDESFRLVVAIGVSLIAVSFLVVAFVAIVAITLFAKLKSKVEPILESAQPVVRTVKETAAVLKPRVLKISEHAVEVSQLVVGEAHRYSDLSKDVAERTKAQVARLDGVVDNTFDQVEDAGGAVKQAVLKPLRKVDGVLAGIRMAIVTYSRGGRSPIHRATQDEEMFI